MTPITPASKHCDPNQNYLVSGRVTYSSGKAAAGLIVRARDHDLRRFQSLGKETRTRVDGSYEIEYAHADFVRAEKDSADLVIRVFSPDQPDPDKPLAESPILFNAPQHAEIDLLIPDSAFVRSEFERHLDEILPLLAGQKDDGGDVAMSELTDADVDFLAGETSIDRQHIVWLKIAFAFAAKVQTSAASQAVAQKSVTTSHISPALFYGWFREGLTDEWDNIIQQPVAILKGTAQAAITDLIIPAELAATIDSAVDSLPNPGRDEVRGFAVAAGLDQQSLKTILQTTAAIPEISNATLSRLIDEKKLDASAAHRLGLGLAAHELLGGNESAITALLQAKNEKLAEGLHRARDLAKLDPSDIEKALSNADVTPPNGMSASEYAQRLVTQISEAFPTDALLHRATTVDNKLVDSIRAVVGSRDTTTRNSEQRQTVQDFINLHPGLGLQKVLDDVSDSTAAVATIKERVGWIELINDLNPDLDLLSVEYLPDSESLAQVSFGDLSDEARSMVVDDLKTYQRLKAVSPGADRIALLKAGYRSATRIARATTEEIATSTGLPVPTARAYKRRAQQKANEAALAWVAFHELERDKHQKTFVQPPDYLKRLPGYQELFGDLSFCNCEQCQSVLGACAYFVDLMFYIDRHISEQSFKNHGGENNSLHLQSRRPDLWTLQLSCDNTNKVVPTLDLVINLLEQFIVKDKQFNSVLALYEQLSGVDYSIRLPFSLPLERLIIFLGHLGISRYQIAQALLLREENNLVKARVRLGMLPKQYQLITGSRLGNLSAAAISAAEQFFELWLGTGLTLSTLPGQTETRAIGELDSQFLMKAAGVSRATLGGVVSSRFVNGDIPGVPPAMEFEIGIATPGGLQNDAERVKNFTSGRLDRFERFVRLWQHLPWTVVELNYVIQQLQAQHHFNSTTINDQIIIDLAQLFELQNQFALTVEELCALWDSPPQIPLQTEISLFDRLFNLPQFLRGDISWPTNNTTIDAGPAVRSRLVAGLQITDADLTELLSNLNASFGRTVTDALGNRTFTPGLWLNLDNLSLLYRHARLARLLQLSINELFATIRWTSSINSRAAANEKCVLILADLLSVMETHRARKASGFSVDEVTFITQTGTTLAGYDDPTAIADRIVSECATEGPLDISPDLFTQVGLTQADSTTVITDNSTAAPGTQPLLIGVPGSESRQISPSINFDAVATMFTFNIDPNPSALAQLGQALYRIAKQAGDSGISAVDIGSLGLSAAEATALLNANASATAVPPKLFELVPGQTDRYRLKSLETVNAAIPTFGANAADVNAARSFLKQQTLDLLLRHHTDAVLAAKASAAAKTTPEKARALLSLVTPNTAAQREALVEALQGGQATTLVTTLDQLIRNAVLFRSAVFDEEALDFIRTNPSALALNPASQIEIVRRVSDYVALATPPDPAFQSGEADVNLKELRDILIRSTSIASAGNADFPTLARALSVDESQIKALLPNISFATGAATIPRIEELSQLRAALALVNNLGIPPEILARAVSEQFSDLSSAADGIFAAVRSKYVDEQAFQDKYEPFEDKLRSRNRDGLVEYLLTAPDSATTDWRLRFLNSNDLYYNFLTDVMVEGCARTSKVVFAISSLQLYVQRVLMNLEATSNGASFTVVFDDEDKRAEWVWRKNYQVWVANRKVFLFPENYIEPSLRDDKTPAFRTLEETLLQKQINEQNTLDAYATYLRDFEELGQLRISGAFHDRGKSNGDLLHLFGVTVGNPPVHYYRTIKDLENSDGPVFSAWEKVDLQIPVRKISPVVFRGTLFVFWVETTSRPMSSFDKGTSTFFAYRHSTHLKYSTLRKDGRWSPPQSLKFIEKTGAPLDPFLKDDYLRNIGGPSPNPVVLSVLTDIYRRDHSQSIENYVPEGWQWDQAYPYRIIGQNNKESLAVRFDPEFLDPDKTSYCDVDLWPGTLLINSTTKFSYPLTGFRPSSTSVDIAVVAGQGLPFYWASRVLYTAETSTQAFLSSFPVLFTSQPTEIQVVNGNEMSAIVQAPGDAFLLRAKFSNPDPNWFSTRNTATSPDYDLLRLGTTIAGDLGVKMTVDGIPGMLDIKYQMDLKEIDPVVTPALTSIASDVGVEPTKNAAGLPYFRELFFHIPFLVADHLNSQQKFSDSQRWYHYLFNPTANESNINEDKRPWRYREFREHDITSMRDAMVNPQALAAYRQDPFNPHAIARLRPGAYQKAIFMKYIDNLLDWGDTLFTQFTMESVNEATMLYVMAADILGPRPIELGSCGESTAALTYTSVAPLLKDDSSDFLIEEFETFVTPTDPNLHQYVPTPMSQRFLLLGPPLNSTATFTTGQALDGAPNPAGWNFTGAVTWKETAGTPLGNLQAGGSLQLSTKPEVGGANRSELRVSGDPVGPPDESPFGNFGQLNVSNFGPLGAPKGFDRSDFLGNIPHSLDDAPPPLGGKIPGGGDPPQLQPSELVQSRLVFCFPGNKELLAYWGRVEDRLNKIRNCMDISGVSRRPELFAPEIDPRMLVRMRAAGLTLDDVLNVTSGNLPPYRFAYLIEKAKAFASVVQNFGNQVMSALERRDTEELTRLRTVHEQNLLKLRSQMTQWEIDSAEDTLEGLRRQQAAAEYRRDHYATLLQSGLSGSETVQQLATHLVSGLHEIEAIVQIVRAGLSLLPQLGAPTAMKYGGMETSGAAAGFASASQALAQASAAAAASAGVEAIFQRREEEWRHQIQLAKLELNEIDRQIAAAEIRRDIATESLNVHNKEIDQVQEVFDLMRDRFTNFGLLTWLSAEMQKLHRTAFTAALSMARLAEQACQFERPDELERPALSGDYWEAANSGLLSGERLLLDLNNLEQRFIETDTRKLEIEQSFSLARFNPDALSKLRLTGECTFSIPEWFFDLTYSGHFRRRVKGVRLTIPCVVGPHTSVGATLRLTESHLRKDPTMSSRVLVPLRHTNSIAASVGQSDPGVFEFNFRDERYMPFEGAGVDSVWQLALPKVVRQFDYNTISDVILRVSYTAEENSDLRTEVEGATGILTRLTQSGITQTLSLRQDLPDVWNRLLAGGTELNIEIRDVHIPYFMSLFDLQQSQFEILVTRLTGAAAQFPTVKFDDKNLADAGLDNASGFFSLGHTSGALDVIGKHVLKITSLGSATITNEAGATRLDSAQIKDIVLRFALKRKATT